jgi:hypothetical protein
MHCINCGGELLDGAAFCSKCGQRTSAEAESATPDPKDSIAETATSDDAVEPSETWPSPNAINGSPKPNHDVREIIATVVLGIAVVAIAWSSLQSSLWGGEQATATTEALLQSNLSVDSYLEAQGLKSLDLTLFTQYLDSCTLDDWSLADEEDLTCYYLSTSGSPQGSDEVEDWIFGENLVPFESQEYLDGLYADGDAELAAASENVDLARDANQNSDRYQTASTILAIVLFFSGVSLVIGYARLRSALLVMASLTLVATIAFLTSIPLA